MTENIGFNTIDCILASDRFYSNILQKKYIRSCFDATFIFAQKETNKTMFKMEIFSAIVNK